MFSVNESVANFPHEGQIAHVNKVIVQLDDITEVAAGGFNRRLQVFEYLLGLGAKVARADELTGLVESNLASDIDQLSGIDLNGLGIAPGFRHGVRIQKLE